MEDSTSIGCNCVHENIKSEISDDFGPKMAMFVISSIRNSYDRPLHYHFAGVGEHRTLYWHYWFVWLGPAATG